MTEINNEIVSTARTEVSALHYASFMRRFAAVLIDGLVLIIPCFFAAHLLPILGGFIVAFLYTPLLEASELRATLGKHALGIQVTDLKGDRITLRSAIVRYFMKSVSSILLGLGYFFALFTARKQALHDLVADTVVIYGTVERGVFDVWLETIRDLFQKTEKRLGGDTHSSSELAELERLQNLREKGALTEAEFTAQKNRILDRKTF